MLLTELVGAMRADAALAPTREASLAHEADAGRLEAALSQQAQPEMPTRDSLIELFDKSGLVSRDQWVSKKLADAVLALLAKKTAQQAQPECENCLTEQCCARHSTGCKELGCENCRAQPPMVTDGAIERVRALLASPSMFEWENGFGYFINVDDITAALAQVQESVSDAERAEMWKSRCRAAEDALAQQAQPRCEHGKTKGHHVPVPHDPGQVGSWCPGVAAPQPEDA